MAPGAAWSSGRQSCPHHGVGTRWPLKSPPTQTVLWFYDSLTLHGISFFSFMLFIGHLGILSSFIRKGTLSSTCQWTHLSKSLCQNSFFSWVLENLLYANDNLPVHFAFAASLYTLDSNTCASGISDRFQHWALLNRWSSEVGQHGSVMQSFCISGKSFKCLAFVNKICIYLVSTLKH